MKTLLYATVAAAALYGSAARATPCTTTTLDTLIGGASCTIGDATFSDFFYTAVGFDPSAPASNIGVTPLPTGLEFNGSWSNPTSLGADAIIKFTISSPNLTDAELQMAGLTGNALDVESFDNGTVISSSDNLLHSATFDAVDSLIVTDDLGVGPNSTVSAIIKTFSQPAPIPEPASLAILGLGLVGLGVLRRRS